MNKMNLSLAGLLIASVTAIARADDAYKNTFGEGENFVYSIRWGAITGGYSNLSIQDMQDVNGKPAYHMVSEAHSTGLVNSVYPVKDRNEAWLDEQTPRTLKYSKSIREGKYLVDQTVELDQDQHRYHRHEDRLDKNRSEEQDGTIPPNAFDVFGSLYYVRTLPLAVGQTYTMDVQSGDKSWPLVVKVTKREMIKVKAGKFDCFKVEPMLREPGMFVAKGKKLEVWITADARRIPVLMRSEICIGHVSAELVSQHMGNPDAVRVSATPKVADVAAISAD